MGRAILDYDVISGLTQRIFNTRLLIYRFISLFIYFRFTYFRLNIYSFIYLFIFNLMAYGHTPFFPLSGEFCPSVNPKTASSISDCIIIHYAVSTSFKHHPVLTD